MKELITIVCCYNKKDIFDKYLDKSLSNQNCNYKLIGIDNSDHQYKSWCQAINSVIKKIDTPFIGFAHQDIEFLERNSLIKLIDVCKEKNGIIGVAGSINNQRYSSVVEGEKNSVACNTYLLKKIMKVQTLDECFFLCSINIFNLISFDDIVCDSWHLYCVDLCIAASLSGINSYVAPVRIHHLSAGNVNYSFYKTLNKLCKKYYKRINNISTTCIKVKNLNPIYVYFFCLYHRLSRLLFKIIKR